MLTEIIKCCTVLSDEEILLLLKQAQLNKGLGKSVSDYIIRVSCEEFEMSRKSVIAREVRGDAFLAISFIYVLHRNHLGQGMAEICNLFGHSDDKVGGAIRKFESLDRDNRFDLELLKRFNAITEKVKAFAQEKVDEYNKQKK